MFDNVKVENIETVKYYEIKPISMSEYTKNINYEKESAESNYKFLFIVEILCILFGFIFPPLFIVAIVLGFVILPSVPMSRKWTVFLCDFLKSKPLNPLP